MIAVARDYVGLRIAAMERLEEAFDDQDTERTLRRAAEGQSNMDEVFEACAPRQSLAAGYYARVDYLFWLEGVMQNIRFSPSEISVTEVEGIRLVAEMRDKFRREHPPCPQCGASNRRFALACRECRHELQGKTN